MLRPRNSQLGDFNAQTVAKAKALFDNLARYHRLEVRHLERIPEGPCLIVANHSGGLSLVDGLFLVEYYAHFGYHKPVYILAHDIVFRFERLRRLMGQVGILRANPGQAERVLEAGHKLLVFPGGDVEAMRPFRERRRVNLAGRTGWARLAMRTQVPVVPVVAAGSHETLVVLGQGKRMAKLLRLKSWARLDSFPALLALPWGLLAGPTCALPYFPLPAKVTVSVGEPVEPKWWQVVQSDPTDQVRALYHRMEHTMQGMLDRMYAERTLPVVG